MLKSAIYEQSRWQYSIISLETLTALWEARDLFKGDWLGSTCDSYLVGIDDILYWKRIVY